MEKIGNVFVITPDLTIENTSETIVHIEKKYILTGELYDSSSGEPLPYAYVQTDKGMTATNELGIFTLVQSNSQPLRIQIHYIGFKTLDTILTLLREPVRRRRPLQNIDNTKRRLRKRSRKKPSIWHCRC